MAIAPIDVFGTCRYVDNISSSSSLFVPFRTQNEWQHFYGAVETGGQGSVADSLHTVKCSRPFTAFATWSVPLPTDVPSCVSATPSTVATPNIYGRVSLTWPTAPAAPENFSVLCHGGATTIGAAVSWVGLASTDNLTSYNPLPATQDWQPSVSYGPDVTLVAASGASSGVSISAVAGHAITLTWNSASSGANATASAGSPTLIASLSGTSANSVSASWTTQTTPAGSAIVTTPNLTAPATTGTATYQITAMGGGLSSTAQASVNLELPITVTLTASPSTINKGGSSTLTWTVANPSAAVISCIASGGWSEARAVSGGGTKYFPNKQHNIHYYLRGCGSEPVCIYNSGSLPIWLH